MQAQRQEGIIAIANPHSSLDIDAIIDVLCINATKAGYGEAGSFGAIVGTVYMGTKINFDIKGSWIKIIDQSQQSFTKYLNIIYGANYGNDSIEKNNIQIDNLIIAGASRSIGSVIFAHSHIVGHHAEFNIRRRPILIRGTHIDMQTASSAIVNGPRHTNNIRNNPKIYLLSINGTLGSSGSIFGPDERVSCKGSMIDWSGINLDTNRLGCIGALELETTYSEQWRQAHHLIADELCQNPKSCFYINEDLLGLVNGYDNTFFLVTRQRYPQNSTNDQQGLIRVSQYTVNTPLRAPELNTSFALNGIRLFTHETKTLPPEAKPLSMTMTDDGRLLMLYENVDAVIKVISMPLMAQHDTKYTIYNILSPTVPIQLNNDVLWLKKNNCLKAYNLHNFSMEIFSKNNSANVIGAQRYHDYVYTAHIKNGTHIAVTRFFNDSRQDVTWSSVVPFSNHNTHHQLHVSGDSHHPIIGFPRITELHYAEDALNNSYLTISLPPEGGPGIWYYGNESVMQPLLTLVPQEILMTHTGDHTTATDILIPIIILICASTTEFLVEIAIYYKVNLVSCRNKAMLYVKTFKDKWNKKSKKE